MSAISPCFVVGARLRFSSAMEMTQTKLSSYLPFAGRKVKLAIEPEAYKKLLAEGFSPEYGAREIERVLNSRLTPMLMREILFGDHKEGFTAVITATEDGYDIRPE